MSPNNKVPCSAIALSREQSDSPRISAKGDNELAQRIIAVAREHNIPVREEPELVSLLADIPLGEAIPASLYAAVSAVLSFTCSLKEQATEGEAGHESTTARLA